VAEPEKPFETPAGDDQAPGEGMSDEEEIQAAKAANRFDIRRLIGGLFLLYGITLTVAGIIGSHHLKHKAAGIDVDLWTGIGMIIFGALMVFWALSRPVMPEPPETRGQGSGRLRRAPAT